MEDAANIEPGSEAWHQLRVGKLTASRVADALARTKSGWSTSRANYAAELVAERLTGTWQEGYVSAEMAWGTDKEAEAIHRLYRDDEEIALMEEQVEMFLSDVANTVRALEQKYGK
jgi:ubiquinone biosynthesis protein UbiJ